MYMLKFAQVKVMSSVPRNLIYCKVDCISLVTNPKKMSRKRGKEQKIVEFSDLPDN